jgi:hypothetical protein
MLVTLDGGATYVEAPQGVQMIYTELTMPGEDSDGELHVNCTEEGIILDVWVDRPGMGHNIGTSSETADEIVERLVKESE